MYDVNRTNWVDVNRTNTFIFNNKIITYTIRANIMDVHSILCI